MPLRFFVFKFFTIILLTIVSGILSGITATQPLYAQGFLVNESSTPAMLPRARVWPPRPPHIPSPRPPVPIQTYKIQELSVEGRIQDQIAEINVSQTFKNTGSTQMEVSFVFPLPYDGAIDQMVLMVDGKEYPAKLLDATAARKTYEDIVRRNRDPALLEWIGTGMFKTNVFPVPAGATRTVTIRYTQLLRKENGVCDFHFPLSTAKYTAEPVEKLSVHLVLESQEELKNIYSPTHEIKEKRTDAKKATVSFEERQIVPSSDLRILFDSGTGELSTRILSFRPDEKEDGFFLLLATPQFVDKSQQKTESAKKAIPKTVLFVFDKSGSMSGEKIVQARDALKFVLNNLNEGDSFNIITYDGRVETFKPEIMEYTPENRKMAVDFCDSIRAGGTTNIGEALSVSLKMLQDKNQPSYVLFLTDGCPTTGERNEMKLVEIAKSVNNVNARIFSFGVGFDVNARLLDRMSEENRGKTEFVLPNENIEERVSRLYSKISDPVLSNVAFEIATKSSDGQVNRSGTNQVYPSRIFDIFAGEQLVILGRYSQPGNMSVELKGKVGEESKSFTFEGNFVQKSSDQNFSFIERLWAMRRIGEILSEIDLKGKNQELLDELIRLSTKHGIFTPYTSFLADENTSLTNYQLNQLHLGRRLDALQSVSGASGVMQRSGNQGMRVSSKIAPQKMMPLETAPAQARSSSGGMGGMGGGMGRGMGMGGMGGGTGMGGMDGGGSRHIRPRTNAAVPGRPAMVPQRGMSGGGMESSDQQQQVRNVNNRAFFMKNAVWIDSTLSEEQQKPENVITVKQFSDEYFKLIDKYGKELSQYLAFDETVLLNFDGKTYRFEQQ